MTNNNKTSHMIIKHKLPIMVSKSTFILECLVLWNWNLHYAVILTRRMAIANGTCVSFCNQPKAQFGYLRRVMPVCRCLHLFCGWRHLATSRESKAHFGLPWVRPWDNHGNVTWMERGSMLFKRIAACTHLSSTVSQ